jgi:glycosyltransferase involved in cell wall biosynthesis
MFNSKKIVVVMPAYNAEETLLKTYNEVIATGIVDEVILVDDASKDRTVEVAKTIPNIRVIVHEKNRGYGGNQKTCYKAALELGADVVIMVHPDYQYTPLLIPAMASMITSGLYDCVIGSRILGGGALDGGMPLWKYIANRFLTFSENILTGAKLSEYHSGYRAFSSALLNKLPLDKNSDDFIFDNQMLVQIIWLNYKIAEITCPTKYFAEASSINLKRSITYGIGCLKEAVSYRLAKLNLGKSPIDSN